MTATFSALVSGFMEILLTPTVMKGYYNAPKETQNVLRRHEDGLLWLHTGDIGRIDENGYIYLDGRMKRLIVRYDGIKISPFSIEKIVLSHRMVLSCCAIGTHDHAHGRGQTPVVFIVPKENDLNLHSVRRLCEAELSEMYWPSEYRIIERLPLTPNGKVDYRALERLAQECEQ